MSHNVSRLANPARRDLASSTTLETTRPAERSQTVAPGFCGAAAGRPGASRLLTDVRRREPNTRGGGQSSAWYFI